MPVKLKQSLRLGVSFKVSKWSSKSKCSRILWPTMACSSNSNKPVASALMPNSLDEHIMPNDSTPRTLACLIEMPGNSAPTMAQGASKPARALAAPHTICKGSAKPTSTLHTCKRSASGCFSADKILATTTLLNGAATACMSSTSSPAMVNAWLRA